MKFRSSSNQFVPTSCQLKVGQYARTISHDSPAPHSYDPTMGRRQRRQPINPPRRRRMGVLNPGSTSLRRASAKLNGRAAALADPPAFGGYFARALCGAAVTRRKRPQYIIISVIVIIIIYVGGRIRTYGPNACPSCARARAGRAQYDAQTSRQRTRQPPTHPTSQTAHQLPTSTPSYSYSY